MAIAGERGASAPAGQSVTRRAIAASCVMFAALAAFLGSGVGVAAVRAAPLALTALDDHTAPAFLATGGGPVHHESPAGGPVMPAATGPEPVVPACSACSVGHPRPDLDAPRSAPHALLPARAPPLAG